MSEANSRRMRGAASQRPLTRFLTTFETTLSRKGRGATAFAYA